MAGGARRRGLRALAVVSAASLPIVLAVGLGAGTGPWLGPREPPVAAAEAPTCAQLEWVPEALESDPVVVAARSIEAPISRQFFLSSGRRHTLRFTARGATFGAGRMIPAMAVACPGGQAWVTYPLLARVLEERADPPELLALVFGHELAHLRFDLGEGGFGRYGEELLSEEERQLRADAHGAFFAALSGFSMRRIADDGTLGRFLVETGGHGDPSGGGLARGRQAALAETVALFDAIEELYRSGITLAFAGLFADASEVLEAADQLTRPHGVPEILLARAFVELGGARGGESPCPLIYPGLSTALSGLRAGATKDGAAPGSGAVEVARILLLEAERYGGPELAIEAARACVALEDGQPATAERHLERARVAAARDGLLTGATPALEALARRIGARREAGAAAHDLGSGPPPERSSPTAEGGLERGGPLASAFGVSDPWPAGDRARCPPGLDDLSPRPRGRSSTPRGELLCGRDRGDRRERWVWLPTRAAGGAAIHLESLVPPPAALTSLEAWRCGPGRLVERGLATDGSRVFTFSCLEAGIPVAVLYVRDGSVVRATRVGISERP